MVVVRWNNGLVFAAEAPDGTRLTLDGQADDALPAVGLSPMQALLAAIAACGAMDVISILEKKRQKVTAYRVEIKGERPPAGKWPRPFQSITIRHIVTGKNVDPAALARAVELSDSKYCSVLATLRESPSVKSEWVVEPDAG
ncbi:MAG: OsmC family protein [Fimbriimonas ginsengisoli]|uniref:OsmC family protein n=1 Tax=Fimbriimonas ginsengisoli TaxID=1005039 RepID=A0A931LTA1_FIMGI|nr:OsmC family protein [Fimbriimonas ginsengisoli]